MAKAKKEQVVEKATEEKVETRMATEDGKIKVKLPKKPKQLSKQDDIVKVDLSKKEETTEEVVENTEIQQETTPLAEDSKEESLAGHFTSVLNISGKFTNFES